MLDKEIYINLIIRFLKKDISVTEQSELFTWVYSNTENESLFYQIKDIWETTRYEHIVENAKTDTEWEKLALRAIKDKPQFIHKKRTITQKIFTALKIAAIVIIAFGIGFFVHEQIPKKVNYAEVNVPYGAKSEFKLPGGSSIWVNSGSKLKYPINPDNAKEINLYLEGEAYFDIVKAPNRKLNVITSTLNIQVLGTTFNVKSYNEDDVVETTLIKGSISITGKVGDKVIKDPILLKPNEQATLVKSESSIEINEKIQTKSEGDSDAEESKTIVKKVVPKLHPSLTICEKIDTDQFTLWKNNVLVFKNERLEDLSKKLERWYNVEIEIKDKDLKESRYTGTFEKETLEQAIEALSLSLPFTYKIEKNKIEIINKN